MPANKAALLKVDGIENVASDQAQWLSRSPHPYHRHRSAIAQDNDVVAAGARNSFLVPILTSLAPNAENSRSTFFDTDHRKRRKQSLTPSDSGTEADDESGAILLGLPAPPLRPRKGLKGLNGSDSASPLLTPSYLDIEHRILASKLKAKRRSSLSSLSCTDEETTKFRQKFNKRRRAELIRRVTEAILLGSIGFTACRINTAWLVRLWLKGNLESANIVQLSHFGHIPAALVSHATIVLSLYILYPVRIVYRNQTLDASRNRSRFYIHIPAAFDPAPLLYPVLIPVFVAMLLMDADTKILLPNLVLSIASIPSKIIPFNSDVPWYNSMHWALSALPILVSQMWYPSILRRQSTKYSSVSNMIDAEMLLLLYPLHQALLPTVRYLTTTSLLPAELQLLSISLINLFVHSQSPQTSILQSLLWIGGLLVFVFCGKVLSWGVALARIPSWRFRQPASRGHRSNAIVFELDQCLNGHLSRWGLTPARCDDSDTDEPVKSLNSHARNQSMQLSNLAIQQIISTNEGRYFQRASPFATSPGGEGVQSDFPTANGEVQTAQGETQRQRRYTLPSYVGSPLDSPSKATLTRRRMASFSKPRSWSFRSLNKMQATVVAWVFALYVYTMIIAVIAFAVRPYVSHKALQDQEPVGWALGYLLGDLPFFRHLVIHWKLESWISLPPIITSHFILDSHNWPSSLKAEAIGAANLRLLICIYCLTVIIAGLAVVFRLSATVEVDTRRKVFHGMMVAMILPTAFVDPPFISLAFTLILAIFLLLDLFRASQLPPLSKPLTYFLAPYVDGRDHRGPVIVSHIFLLIGCAIPLWLTLAAIDRTGERPWQGWDVPRRDLSMVSGVICVGMGDAAASLIGRRYGRRRWCWSGGKSLEGSLAFAIAVVVGLVAARLWLLVGGWEGDSGDAWPTTLGKAGIAAAGASLTEAVLTGGNDNVVVPVVLWLLVRGLRI